MSEAPTRPWHSQYKEVGISPTLEALPHRNLAEMVHACCTKWQTESQVKAAFSCVVPNGMNRSPELCRGGRTLGCVCWLSACGCGFKPGDRVAVQLPNSLGYPVVALGVFKAGCVLVNTNSLYTESEMVHQFNNAGARVLVMVDMFADKLPGVLAKTQIEKVVLAAVTEFFRWCPVPSCGVQRFGNRRAAPGHGAAHPLARSPRPGRAPPWQPPPARSWTGRA